MSLIDVLRSIVGDANVLVDGDLSAYEVDWRKRYRGRALAVVRPASTGEVAALVKACGAHGTSIVTQGGNTGLVGASIPDRKSTRLNSSHPRLSRMPSSA